MDTIFFEQPVYVRAWSSCVGKKESEGPLGRYFANTSQDNLFGEKTWEKAERRMIETAWQDAVQKSGIPLPEIGVALGGDLLNQCVSTSFSLRDSGIPFLGLYGACSTMAESLLLGASLVSSGLRESALCMASSHFCSAERQYRFPLEYGSQRPPSAQWTATAAGAVVLARSGGSIRVTRVHIGRIFDPGVTDAGNMGAAMAQSAYETLTRYFAETGEQPSAYDLIVTGDLAGIGKRIVLDLCEGDGLNLEPCYDDCGMLLYNAEQEVNAGGSGCGCSAAVLTGYLLPALADRRLRRILFCGTGALLSPLTTNQGESVPGICHLICLEAV